MIQTIMANKHANPIVKIKKIRIKVTNKKK